MLFLRRLESAALVGNWCPSYQFLWNFLSPAVVHERYPAWSGESRSDRSDRYDALMVSRPGQVPAYPELAALRSIGETA